MMSRRVMMILPGLVLLAAFAGCGGGKQVTRVDPTEQIDLSGQWNDVDSRQVAEDLVAQITAANWVDQFRDRQGRKPILILGEPRNKTTEHIPTKTLYADLERAFINGGRVTVVASQEERDELRGERADQQDFASPETVKKWGRELGADYMLIGELNILSDREGGNEVKYYQTDAYLADLQTNEKIWAGFSKIKKFIGRSKYKG
jgi:penicillin-binding protein activator